MCTTDLDGSRSVDRSINSECGIHVSNTFQAVHGCPGNPQCRLVTYGCPNVCDNIDCILLHVDPALRSILTAEGNTVLKK
eukprot:gene6092-9231_t